jgi:isoleucyl-tRNA synthetase
LVKLLAPFLTFTCDEAWSFARTGKEYSEDSIHLQDWPVAPAEWTNPGLAAEFEQLLKLRARATEKLEPLRQAGTIGKSLDATLRFSGDAQNPGMTVLQKHRDALPEFFIVSHVSLEPKSGAELDIVSCHASETGLVRCPRCWRWVPKILSSPHGEVCPRCAEALNS